ncbi:hypothetical protein PR048_004549 [Dryococelus australis]|uniref:Uncharacterized protein n=1 Tax=Dryococelus australis TaxID=614101 RepID=A0ABQ9I6U2_9NEOP|nr:hypothetical protein PR048_004549 [Dryococelus australis]
MPCSGFEPRASRTPDRLRHVRSALPLKIGRVFKDSEPCALVARRGGVWQAINMQMPRSAGMPGRSPAPSRASICLRGRHEVAWWFPLMSVYPFSDLLHGALRMGSESDWPTAFQHIAGLLAYGAGVRDASDCVFSCCRRLHDSRNACSSTCVARAHRASSESLRETSSALHAKEARAQPDVPRQEARHSTLRHVTCRRTRSTRAMLSLVAELRLQLRKRCDFWRPHPPTSCGRAGCTLDLRSYLSSTLKTVAPFELRAGLEIGIKVHFEPREIGGSKSRSEISSHRRQIKIRTEIINLKQIEDRTSSSIYYEKYAYFYDVIYHEQIAKFCLILNIDLSNIDESEIQNHEIALVQHFYIGTKIKLDSDRGRFWCNRPLDIFASLINSWDQGDRAVSLLVSHQGDPGSISGWVTSDFRMWESCRTMSLVGGFSRGSPVSPALSFRSIPQSPTLALKIPMRVRARVCCSARHQQCDGEEAGPGAAVGPLRLQRGWIRQGSGDPRALQDATRVKRGGNCGGIYGARHLAGVNLPKAFSPQQHHKIGNARGAGCEADSHRLTQKTRIEQIRSHGPPMRHKMEQSRNARAGEMRDPQENPPTSGIVQCDSHERKSGSGPPGLEPGSPRLKASALAATSPRLPGVGCKDGCPYHRLRPIFYTSSVADCPSTLLRLSAVGEMLSLPVAGQIYKSRSCCSCAHAGRRQIGCPVLGRILLSPPALQCILCGASGTSVRGKFPTSAQSMSRQSQCSRVLQAPSHTVGFTRRFHSLSSIHATNTSLAVVPQSPVVAHTSLHSRTLGQAASSLRPPPRIFPNSRDASLRDEAAASLTRTYLRCRQTHRNLQQGREAVTYARRRAARQPDSLSIIRGFPLNGGGQEAIPEEGRAEVGPSPQLRAAARAERVAVPDGDAAGLCGGWAGACVVMARQQTTLLVATAADSCGKHACLQSDVSLQDG